MDLNSNSEQVHGTKIKIYMRERERVKEKILKKKIKMTNFHELSIKFEKPQVMI